MLYLRDAYLASFEATVVDCQENAVALDRTAFYPTGGGQPHDVGTLGGWTVVDVRKDGDVVWHTLSPATSSLASSSASSPQASTTEGSIGSHSGIPSVGTTVHGEVEWSRRHQLMRTHTALHILCGVIWNEWRVPVTGGNMEPLAARMDFEFDPLPEGFAARVEQLVNHAIARDYPIEVSFLPRNFALQDADLIRTKVSLIPEQVSEIRVVDIVGLDKQADGGTHVRSTKEVGTFRVVKTESKGKGNKRLRVEIG
ncbi:MAG: alanyl-tRNA editing protein [Ilumatobacteraceae bacterium]